MESQERKAKFVLLLQDLRDECDGVKKRLAEKLDVIPSRLTRWLQGKIDPAGLEISAFYSISRVKGCSLDELAELFDYPLIEQQPIDKFRLLIQELLFDRTQDELGKKIGVSQISISNWLNPNIPLDPSKIPSPTMFALAREKGWSLERLLVYLNFEFGKIEEDLLFKYRMELSVLSLKQQIKLLNWLSNLVEENLAQSENLNISQLNQIKSNDSLDSFFHICIILEQEDISIASRYTGNLSFYLKLDPNNIEITTLTSLPASFKNFDLLIFDIQTDLASVFKLINEISFDGDIVIFTSSKKELEVRNLFNNKITDIVVKPIDWYSLKDKPYFS